VRLRRHWFSGLIALVVIVFLWAPLVIVAINSVNSDTLLVSWKGFTTHWYSQAAHNGDVQSGVKQTMTIALASTAISLVLAVTGALWWRRSASPRWRCSCSSQRSSFHWVRRLW
jgi:spermidine/putrescine transport system permease protein